MQTAVEQIEHQLVLSILRGDYQPDDTLPTMRAMARTFEVNLSTIQQVVTRLKTRGLIAARQGSGLRVLDLHQNADLGLLPFWIEASLDDPAEATSLFENFLEARRIIAVRLIENNREAILDHSTTIADVIGEAAKAMKSQTLAEFQVADMALARAVVGATGNRIALAILNSIEKILEVVPQAGEAMYADRHYNITTMMEVIALIQEGKPGFARVIEEKLVEMDDQNVQRFRAILERELESKQAS